MQELKQKIEAVLFAVGKKMELEEISKICKTRKHEDIKNALFKLQKDYEQRSGPVKLINEDSSWKLGVDGPFIPVIQNLGVETELSKSIMETLAVIAWKYPILQNEVIHIRTNKAYDHLSELEELGFITRSKHGRTRTIKLTEKFFQYFDLPNKKEAENAFKEYIPAEIQDKVEQYEQEILTGEKASEEIEEKKKALAKERKKAKVEQERLEAGIDLEDKEGERHHLEEYDKKLETKPEKDDDLALVDETSGEPEELETYGEKKPETEETKKEIGNLEIYKEKESDEEEDEDKTEETVETKEKEGKKNIWEDKKDEEEGEGISAEEKDVQEEIEKILHPKQEEEKEEKRKNKEEPEEQKSDEEEEGFGLKQEKEPSEESKEEEEGRIETLKTKKSEKEFQPLIDEGGDIPEHAKHEEE